MKNEPAFPTDSEGQNGPNSYHFTGISIRDYFAAKAMHGFICHPSLELANNNTIAKFSYEMADAMLKARDENEN